MVFQRNALNTNINRTRLNIPSSEVLLTSVDIHHAAADAICAEIETWVALKTPLGDKLREFRYYHADLATAQPAGYQFSEFRVDQRTRKSKSSYPTGYASKAALHLSDLGGSVESFRRGYPRLSAFIDSDRDFMMFRRFGRLQARILLHKQDELIDLEQQLEQIDSEEQTEYYLSCRRQDLNTKRHSLIQEAEVKLNEYSTVDP